MFKAITRLFSLDKHRHPIDHIAKLNALISGVALYPQLFKALFTGNVIGFSIATYILITLNSLIWIFFAIHRKLLPLLISSTLNCLAALMITTMILSS